MLASRPDALREMVRQYVDHMHTNQPVHTWPADAWMHRGGKKGVHSEHLGFILAEMQFLQRAYPASQW